MILWKGMTKDTVAEVPLLLTVIWLAAAILYLVNQYVPDSVASPCYSGMETPNGKGGQ